MKKVLLKALMFIFPTVLVAQNIFDTPVLKWSEVEHYNHRTDDYNSVIKLAVEDHYYNFQILNYNSNDPEIKVFERDEEFNVIRTNTIVLKSNDKYRSFNKAVNVGSDIYVFSTQDNVSKGKKYLFAQKINPVTLSLDEELQLIFEADFKGRNRYNTGFYNVEVSEDHSKILVIYSDSYSRKFHGNSNFKVFDTHLNMQWESMPISLDNKKQYTKNRFNVMNSGDVVLYRKVYKDKLKPMDMNPIHELLTFSSDTNYDIGRRIIQSKGAPFKNLKVQMSEGDISVTSFYGYRGNADGIYIGKLIDDEFKEVYIPLSRDKNMKRLLFDLYTENLIKIDENRFYVIGEKRNIEYLNGYAGSIYMNRESIPLHNFLDIYVFKVNFSKKIIEWDKSFGKHQLERNSTKTLSAAVWLGQNEELHLLYNDNLKNHTKADKMYKMTSMKNHCLTLVKIDKDGGLIKGVVKSDLDNKVLITPNTLTKIKSNVYSITGDLKNVNQVIYGKLTL